MNITLDVSNSEVQETIIQYLDKVVPELVADRLEKELQTKRIYNISEACILLDMSFNTIKKFLWNGDLKYCLAGDRAHFMEGHLIDFIKSGKWSKTSINDYNKNKKHL